MPLQLRRRSFVRPGGETRLPDEHMAHVSTLAELLAMLDGFADGRVERDVLARALDGALAADPLGVERTDSAPWDAAPDDARLFWRLVYQFDNDTVDVEQRRRLAARIVRCHRRIGSADTHEMLPLLVDQERLCVIAERHLRGVISRTGFLSAIAESGYPAHLKLWLEYAPAAALERLCAQLGAGQYDVVAMAIERKP